MNKKTKIVCSIGPSSVEKNVMREMILKGMNVARINFSHATIEERHEVEKVVRELNEELRTNVAIMYDTKGPDFRTGNLVNDSINLVEGKTIRIVKEDILGTEEKFTVNYKNALDSISIGNIILLEDGLMKLEVIDKDDFGLTCKILVGGVLGNRKGINVPGVKLDMPFLSETDVEDIKYACINKGDFLALSFVSSADDIKKVRDILKEMGDNHMQIVSKIESDQAIANLESIIDASDGIMVARGDLGVEVPMDKVPMLQKDMIKKSHEMGKFSIVATEMLASMYKSARPTRAEVSDIANAVLDGCDAVMLSGETTIGKYPIEAVRYMADVCRSAEEYYNREVHTVSTNDNDVTTAIAKAVLASVSSLNVKAIVVPTSGGHSAKVMSNLRPQPIVLATCPSEEVARRLALNYGVYTKIVPEYDDLDKTVTESKKEAVELFGLEKKDIIIVTGGIHDDPKIKQTNFLKIEEI